MSPPDLIHASPTSAGSAQVGTRPVEAHGFRPVRQQQGSVTFTEHIRPTDTWRSIVPAALVAEHGWTRPCDDMFALLAAQHPDTLLELLERGGLPAAELTYAAEAAGLIATPRARRALSALLGHASHLVREGALYGIAHHRSEAVDERLHRIASFDPSPAVRTTAADILRQG